MKLVNNPGNQSFSRTALSNREQEILFLLAQGKSSQTISSELDVSLNTIRVHRKNIYFKLQVKKPAGAVRKGFELGYLNL